MALQVEGVDMTIAEIAELVARIVGYKGTIVWDTTKPDGTPRKVLNVDRINKLGWRARFSTEAGIQLTYDWWLSQLKSKI